MKLVTKAKSALNRLRLKFVLNKLLDTKLFFFAYAILFSSSVFYKITQTAGLKNIHPLALELNVMYLRYFGKLADYQRLRKKVLNLGARAAEKKKVSTDKSILFELLSGSDNKEECLAIMEDVLSSEDPKVIAKLTEKFSEKKILVLGPAPTSFVPRFSEFDLVVSANTMPSVLKELKPEKIVRFYNIGYTARNIHNINEQVRSGQTILIKPPIKIEGSLSNRVHNFLSPRKLMFNDYGPMGLQNILYSLWAGGAKEVFIIGFTGYLGEQAFMEGIKSYSSKDLRYILSGIRRHEPMSNFNFVKKMLELNLCDGEDQFRDVFLMPPEIYAHEIGVAFRNKSYRPNLDSSKYGL